MRLTAVARCTQWTNVLKNKVWKRNFFWKRKCLFLLSQFKFYKKFWICKPKGFEYAKLYHHSCLISLYSSHSCKMCTFIRLCCILLFRSTTFFKSSKSHREQSCCLHVLLLYSLIIQTRSQSNSNLIHSSSLSLNLSLSCLRTVWCNRTLLHCDLYRLVVWTLIWFYAFLTV
jgi:hypothetical protein